MKTIVIKPKNVCSREMNITLDDDNTIIYAEIIGGCNGNLQGICKLIEGLNADKVIDKLSNIKCRGSRTGQTSCPDQLAQGLKESLKSN